MNRIVRKYYYQLSLILVYLLGSLVGVSFAWTFAMVPKLQSPITEENPFDAPITQLEANWLTTLLFLSAIIGCGLFSYTYTNLGYKPALVMISSVMTLSFLLMGFSKSSQTCFVGRAIGGLSVGGFFVTGPVYIQEISIAKYRGSSISSSMGFMVVGSSVTYIMGPNICFSCMNLWSAFLGCMVTVFMCLVILESPWYLVKIRRELQAKDVLIHLRNTTMVDNEFRSLYDEVYCFNHNKNVCCLFTESNNLKGLLISMILIVLQQLSGINVVLLNLRSIFKIFEFDVFLGSVSLSGGQLLGSILCAVFVDRGGRKLLLFLSTVGVIICQILLGISFYLQFSNDFWNGRYVCVTSLILLGLFNNLGYGSVSCTVMTEIFRLDVKTFAIVINSICHFSLWFVITQCCHSDHSENVKVATGICVFAIFNVSAVLFIILYMPETKLKSWKEIDDLLKSC